MLLFYNERLFCGLGLSNGRLHRYALDVEQRFPPASAVSGDTVHLRVVSDANVVSFYRSIDGVTWTKEVSFEVSGYNHNIGDGFLSLRPALFASGSGSTTFRYLSYSQ